MNPQLRLLILSMLILSVPTMAYSRDSNTSFGEPTKLFTLEQFPTGGSINSEGEAIVIVQRLGQIFSLYDLHLGRKTAVYERPERADLDAQVGFDQQGHVYIPGKKEDGDKDPGVGAVFCNVDVIDLDDGKLDHQISPVSCNHPIVSVAVSLDSEILAARTSKNEILIYNLRTCRVIERFVSSNGQPVNLALSPNGSSVALGYVSGRVELRDSTTGKVKLVIKAHDSRINDLIFSSDGTVIYTSAAAVILNDVNRIKDFTDNLDLPSLTDDEENVRSWDVSSGMRLGVFITRRIPHAGARIALSYDNKILFVAKGVVPMRSSAAFTLAAFDTTSMKLLDEKDVSRLRPVQVVTSKTEEKVYLICQEALYQIELGHSRWSDQ